MFCYEDFKKLPIDHSVVGLIQQESYERYFCTPEQAEIIGCAGVDGIHYCTIPDFDEMIFAVSPMNYGDYVHPIARNFEDLLRMLLYCGDMAALEQCYAWDEEQFKAFLPDCPPTEQQRAALEIIKEASGLMSMENTFTYIKELQNGFDLSQIPYSEDYYDEDMNPAAPSKPSEWKVTYEGGFWSREGEDGREVPIQKSFFWGEERWYIPALYLCPEGLVIDYCTEVEPHKVKAFIEKWDLLHEAQNHYTRQQQAQMQQEHPLRMEFSGRIILNSEKLHQAYGGRLTWIPSSCIPERLRPRDEAQQLLQHYGLDESRAWVFHRQSYPRQGLEEQALRGLKIHMERLREHISGQCFLTPPVGESITINHPLTGKTYLLTVMEAEPQELPERIFPDPNMEHPRSFLSLTYALQPEHSGFLLRDCAEGDSPRRRQSKPTQPENPEAAAIGLIGGADGPVAVFVGAKTPKLHAAASSLHFAPPKEVQWQAVFSEKRLEDITVELNPTSQEE